MRRIEQTTEVRETVELTGQDIQLIVRALRTSPSPESPALVDAELNLLTDMEELLYNNDLSDID